MRDARLARRGPRASVISGNARADSVAGAGEHPQAAIPPFDERVPYNVAVVELDEGPRLVTNVVGIPPEKVHIGMAVVLAAEVHGDIGLPLFRPAT